MELDARIVYEVALNRVLEKEKQLIEMSALYNQSLQLIKELQDELEKYRELIGVENVQNSDEVENMEYSEEARSDKYKRCNRS